METQGQSRGQGRAWEASAGSVYEAVGRRQSQVPPPHDMAQLNTTSSPPRLTPGRHSEKPFDALSHYHVSLEGKIGQEVAGEGETAAAAAGVVSWFPPHDLIFFLSWHSSLVQPGLEHRLRSLHDSTQLKSQEGNGWRVGLREGEEAAPR